MGHKKRTEKLLGAPSGFEVRERNPELLKHEGWFYVEADLDERVAALHTEYVESKSTLKFTRWLLRFKYLSPADVSEIGKQLTDPVAAKFSCRHNDLVRLADTRHYKSCMAKTKSLQQLHYLADPDIAVVFIPDSAGKFLWRALVRLVHNDKGELSLVLYRRYGNASFQAVVKALKAKTGMPIYEALDIRTSNSPSLHLYSPTVHTISALRKPIWTDHRVGMTERSKIFVSVFPTPL